MNKGLLETMLESLTRGELGMTDEVLREILETGIKLFGENEQLQGQNAAMRDILKNIEFDKFCDEQGNKIYRCLFCGDIKPNHLQDCYLNKALSNAADYHNPSDMAEIKRLTDKLQNAEDYIVLKGETYHNPNDVAMIEDLNKQIAASDVMIKEHCKTIAEQMVTLAKTREALEWAGSALRQSPCLCHADRQCLRCDALAAIDAGGGEK